MKTLNKEAAIIHKRVLERNTGSLVTVLTIISIVIQLVKLYNTCNKTGTFFENINNMGKLEKILIKRFIKKSIPNSRDADIVEDEIMRYLESASAKKVNAIYGEVIV